MDHPPPSSPWPPPDAPRPRKHPCLWLGTTGCVFLLLLTALLVGIVILLVKFIWGLRLDQWL